MTATPMCSKAAAQAALDALLAKLNVSAPGIVKIWSGAMPANCEAIDAGTHLATLTLSTTAFPASATNTSPAGAKATANAITSDTNAANTGTAGYFRAYDGAGTCVIQGDAGTSAADMILNTTSIVAGATVSCTSWNVTLPDGA